MTQSDLPIHTEFFRTLTEAAAAKSVPLFRSGLSVDNKLTDGFDPVTEADKSAERAIRVLLEEHYPDHCILGEEEGESGGPSPYRWVIDPVDGTRAFICGVPVWTTLIGLEQDDVPIAGVIAQPVLDEQWIGIKGQGAVYFKGAQSTPINTSNCSSLATTRMMVTDVRANVYLSVEESAAIHDIANRAQLLRQGLDAYGFALVAMGQMDLVIEAGLSWYDIAAVIPVIEAAGGVAVDWQGNSIREDFHRGRIIVAASQALADEVLETLAKVA